MYYRMVVSSSYGGIISDTTANFDVDHMMSGAANTGCIIERDGDITTVFEWMDDGNDIVTVIMPVTLH